MQKYSVPDARNMADKQRSGGMAAASERNASAAARRLARRERIPISWRGWQQRGWLASGSGGKRNAIVAGGTLYMKKKNSGWRGGYWHIWQQNLPA